VARLRACDLCQVSTRRHPRPSVLTNPAIEDWSRSSLATGEAIGDPAALSDYLPYWIMLDGRCLFTLAVGLRDPGWREL
jgi:hypothetical protein